MSDLLTQHVIQLQAADVQQRVRAAEALCRSGREAQTAALDLIRALEDESAEVADWANAALEDLGPPLPDHVEPLSRLVNEPHEGVSYWAATLLGRLGPQAAAAQESLRQALQQHASLPTRQRAAWSLGQIGPAAQAALQTLQAASRETDARLARLAQHALQQIHSADDSH